MKNLLTCTIIHVSSKFKTKYLIVHDEVFDIDEDDNHMEEEEEEEEQQKQQQQQQQQQQ